MKETERSGLTSSYPEMETSLLFLTYPPKLKKTFIRASEIFVSHHSLPILYMFTSVYAILLFYLVISLLSVFVSMKICSFSIKLMIGSNVLLVL